MLRVQFVVKNLIGKFTVGEQGRNMFYIGAHKGMLEIGFGQTELAGVLQLYSTTPNIFHHFSIVDDGAGNVQVYQDTNFLGGLTYEGETETEGGEEPQFVIGGSSSHWSADSKANAIVDEVRVYANHK